MSDMKSKPIASAMMALLLMAASQALPKFPAYVD